MKSIIEREATYKNHSDMGVQSNTEKFITSICKRNIMQQDMLSSQIHLTSQASRGSLPSK